MIRDLRHALRFTRRNLPLTVVSGLCIALVVGVNAAVMGALDAVMLRPLPLSDLDRLASVYELPVGESEEARMRVSYPTYEDWRSGARTTASLAALASVRLTLTTSELAVEPLRGEITSASYFEVLEIEPILGRTYRPEEARPPEAGRVCILGHGLWRRRFHSDPEVLGRVIHLSGLPFTVLGVMPSAFRGLRGNTQIWIPVAAQQEVMHRGLLTRRGSHWLTVLARPKTGVTRAQTQSKLTAVARRLAERYPDSHRNLGVLVLPLRQTLVSRDVRRALWILTGGSVFLLVIAYSNLAGLQLIAIHGRRHELALRIGLGASRRHLVRQMMAESLVLSFLGGLGSVLVALGCTKGLAVFSPPRISRLTFDFDYFNGTFSLGLALVLGVLLALVPLFAAAGVDVAGHLKEPEP
jgi:predicted permease